MIRLKRKGKMPGNPFKILFCQHVLSAKIYSKEIYFKLKGSVKKSATSDKYVFCETHVIL